MSVLDLGIVLVLLLVVLPVCAYMVMKFGATGYFRAKQKTKKEG